MSRAKCVTKADCDVRMAPLGKSIDTIEKALVGDDMMGGLVGEVHEVKAKVDSLIKDKEISLLWKLAIFSTGFTAFVAIVIEVVRGLA